MFFDTKECEWADMITYISGSRLIKIRGIRFSIKQEKEAIYGEGDEPLAIQNGNRAYDGEIKLLVGALNDMDDAAVLAGGRDALDLEFDVQVVFRARSNRKLRIFNLIGVQITELTRNWDQNAKMMEVTLPIVFLRQKSA